MRIFAAYSRGKWGILFSLIITIVLRKYSSYLYSIILAPITDQAFKWRNTTCMVPSVAIDAQARPPNPNYPNLAGSRQSDQTTVSRSRIN